ncbi:MAG TPA: SEC-C metal-binding domain-containing protein, partial [Candidatus Limnocylindria bacterium]|nr:SEC-C metal-binding domain-containing protein [Candidatus Limnocylindria bacterium]
TNVLEASPEQYQAALAEADQICAEDRDKVLAAGGLHIVGTERHDARRIDNQLRGRAGRQGDPGSSRFYLSLEDDLMRRFASDRVSSIMGRLGFDDETALESGMVSRTIEGAQTRVEGYNFDARKHVVQYDDVINRQRETIYHERERIIRSKDLSPTILLMLEEEIRGLVLQHTAGDSPAEWNRAGLKAHLAGMIPTLSPAALTAIDGENDPNALAATLVDAVADAYEAKRREAGAEAIAVLERIVLLRVIDSLWVEHLTAVDDMRRGIGLRAYSQRDPLNEFKVEAYRMFDELKSTIRHDVSNNIFRLSVAREPVPQQPRRVTEGRIDLATGAVAAEAVAGAGNGNGARQAAAQNQAVRAGPKIGRNDPCWCGSGKKYKRCHGA